MQSHSAEKKAHILDAAQKRFARYGLSKVTMDEIAADLGMSKAALYYYFQTKEEIFREVIAREQQEFIDRVAVIIEEKCPAADKLRHYFDQHLTFLNELLNLKIIHEHADDDLHSIMHELFREFSRKEAALLETILRTGKTHHEFAIDSAEKTASLLQHVLQGLRISFLKKSEHNGFDETEIKNFAQEIRLFSAYFIKGILP
jgi:TetR/AcrR family transcriptional repressor of mexJK operon